ncbi:cytokine receptor-like isoform X2 [Eupeodes corollae]|nr:cytokine receptor-like isoform X2 [Eupeodes corollae]
MMVCQFRYYAYIIYGLVNFYFISSYNGKGGRFLGILTITFGFSYANELGCRTLENLSSLEPTYVFIDVKTGDDFNVTCCVINNAHCLSIVEKSHYQIPNLKDVNTSIKEVTIQNAMYKKHSYEFTCKCYEKGFKVTYVSVGTAPKNVKELICVVVDFLKMECIVELNYESIDTRYSFLLDESELPAKQISYGDNPKYAFNLTEPKYKIERLYYNFTLKSSNSMGSFSEQKLVQQYKIVKPQLRNIKLTNITSNGVLLVWDILNRDAYTKNTTGDLFFSISLRSDRFEFSRNDFSIENQGNHFWVKIANLYPFVKYGVNIRVKANLTFNNERMWSNTFEESFTTSSKKPNKPPYIGIGNFYVHPKEKIISLFWQQMPEYEHNGPNFEYEISNIMENRQFIKSLRTITTNSAAIIIDWKNTSEYEFQLRSRNKEGFSSAASILKISPRNPNIKHEEQKKALTKVYNQTYTLFWSKPTYFTGLSSFTLFWCSAEIESQNRCKGPMEFIYLDRKTLNYTTNISSTTNFALSENYYDNSYSSGMMWFKCSKNTNMDSFEIKFDYPVIPTEDSITIKWIEECWHMPIIEMFIVTYCEDNTNYCEKEIIPKQAKYHTIRGLKPSSSYKITITSILKTGLRLISNPITATTKIENNTTTLFIFACSAIIGIVAFIVLGIFIKKRIHDMMNIKIILPNVDGKRNRNQFGDYKFGCTAVCEERIPWDIFTPPQVSQENLQTQKQTTTSDEYISMDQASISKLAPTSVSLPSPTSNNAQNREILFLQCSNRKKDNCSYKPNAASGVYVFMDSATHLAPVASPKTAKSQKLKQNHQERENKETDCTHLDDKDVQSMAEMNIRSTNEVTASNGYVLVNDVHQSIKFPLVPNLNSVTGQNQFLLDSLSGYINKKPCFKTYIQSSPK